jgi:hypothetical protein
VKAEVSRKVTEEADKVKHLSERRIIHKDKAPSSNHLPVQELEKEPSRVISRGVHRGFRNNSLPVPISSLLS